MTRIEDALRALDLPARMRAVAAADDALCRDTKTAVIKMWADELAAIEAAPPRVLRASSADTIHEWDSRSGLSAICEVCGIWSGAIGANGPCPGSPAQVAAPKAAEPHCDWTDAEVETFLSIAMRHVEIRGELECAEIRQGVDVITLARSRAQTGEPK